MEEHKVHHTPGADHKSHSTGHKAPEHKTHHAAAHPKSPHKTHNTSSQSNWILGLLVVVALLLLINLFMTMSISSKLGAGTGNTVTGAVTGNNNAPAADGAVIIEEYSDFQCPFCSRALPSIEQIKETYGDKVNVIYKHFPLDSIHPDARSAAEASECARDQGKFWEYHDLLFANQGALDSNSLKQYAEDLGLDTDTFNNCVDSGEKSSIVDRDFAEGRAKGVSGTPTFFVNGQELGGAQPFSAFKPLIDAALSGKAPSPAAAPSPSAPAAVPAKVNVEVGNDPVKGLEDAKITIIEYSDFQCPFCTRAQETLKQLEDTYGDDLRIVYKHYPLGFHPEAAPAAEASECAQEQGRFWEYHDLLFENQATLGTDNYKQWASDLGLDTTQFDDCLDSSKYADEVAKDLAEGSAAGVQGTPGFFINGVPLRGAQPFSVFKQVIEAELAGQ